MTIATAGARLRGDAVSSPSRPPETEIDVVPPALHTSARPGPVRPGGEALEPLLRGLRDPDVRARMHAVKAALESGVPDLAGVLLAAGSGERNHRIRAAMVYAVGRLGREAHVAELARHLKDPEARVRWRAVEAIGRIGAPAGYPVLVRALGCDEDDGVRSAAASLLLRLGTERLLGLFEEMVRSDRPWKRQASILACQLFNSRLVVPVLVFAFTAGSEPERKLARAGLERLAKLGNEDARRALDELAGLRQPSQEQIERISRKMSEVTAASGSHAPLDDTYTEDLVPPPPERIPDPGDPDPDPGPRPAPGPEPAPVPALRAPGPSVVRPLAPLAGPTRSCPVCGTSAPRSRTHCPRCGSSMGASLSGLLGKPKLPAKKRAARAAPSRPWLGPLLRVLLGIGVLALNGAVFFHAYQLVVVADVDSSNELSAKLTQMVGFAACALAVSGGLAGFLTTLQARSGLIYGFTFRGAYLGYLLLGAICISPRLLMAFLVMASLGGFLRGVDRHIG